MWIWNNLRVNWGNGNMNVRWSLRIGGPHLMRYLAEDPMGGLVLYLMEYPTDYSLKHSTEEKKQLAQCIQYTTQQMTPWRPRWSTQRVMLRLEYLLKHTAIYEVNILPGNKISHSYNSANSLTVGPTDIWRFFFRTVTLKLVTLKKQKPQKTFSPKHFRI